MHIYTHISPLHTDTITPVGAYLNLRNHYRKPVLMESNDYHSRSESRSCIGLNPLVEIVVQNTVIEKITPEGITTVPLRADQPVSEQLEAVTATVLFARPEIPGNGFFACFGFEYAHLEAGGFETGNSVFPKAHLIVFEYLLVFDHFHDTGTVIVNSITPHFPDTQRLQQLLHAPVRQALPFRIENELSSPVSDARFLEQVSTAKQHICRGDVFQLVVSRPFQQAFFGDDFQVYRQLRNLNPSPYLFYADLEAYRIMGSSPETQLRIENGVAGIHPIAGTVRKTGDAATDRLLTEQLIADEKENAEHTMLVDLARNDLSKYCSHVRIQSYKEVQQFSHVIHLVSSVTGKLETTRLHEVFAGTFPAGTLSGTPKLRALELIRAIEADERGYYGGAIGFMGSNGTVQLAITIRSCYSQNNVLHLRAGAGVVYDSVPESELQEVNTKLGALRKAILTASVPQTAAV